MIYFLRAVLLVSYCVASSTILNLEKQAKSDSNDEDLNVSFDLNAESLEKEDYKNTIKINMEAIEKSDSDDKEFKASYALNLELLEEENYKDAIHIKDAEDLATRKINELTVKFKKAAALEEMRASQKAAKNLKKVIHQGKQNTEKKCSKTIKTWQENKETITFYNKNTECMICFNPYETDRKAVKFACHIKSSDGHHMCEQCRDATFKNNVVEYENIKVGICPTCRKFIPIDEMNNNIFPELQHEQAKQVLEQKIHRLKNPEEGMVIDDALLNIQTFIEIATATDDDDLWKQIEIGMVTLEYHVIESFMAEADLRHNLSLYRAARNAKSLKRDQHDYLLQYIN